MACLQCSRYTSTLQVNGHFTITRQHSPTRIHHGRILLIKHDCLLDTHLNTQPRTATAARNNPTEQWRITFALSNRLTTAISVTNLSALDTSLPYWPANTSLATAAYYLGCRTARAIRTAVPFAGTCCSRTPAAYRTKISGLGYARRL
jgi:hypothetical protein